MYIVLYVPTYNFYNDVWYTTSQQYRLLIGCVSCSSANSRIIIRNVKARFSERVCGCIRCKFSRLRSVTAKHAGNVRSRVRTRREKEKKKQLQKAEKRGEARE